MHTKRELQVIILTLAISEEKKLKQNIHHLFSYRFGHISRTLKALQHSFKTSLRIDRDGLLSLQFLMPKPGRGGGGDAFIEFRVRAFNIILMPYLNTNLLWIGSVWR